MAIPIPGVGVQSRQTHRFAVTVGLLVLTGVALMTSRGPNGAVWPPEPVFWGYLAILVFLAVASTVSGSRNPLIVTIGADGRLSTSKFQFFVWTGVVAFTYVWIFASRLMMSPEAGPLNDLPNNVLLAMGFSMTTAVAAKGITTSYQSSGRLTKSAAPSGQDASLAGLVAHDDLATPDLTKIQMLLWTIVAATVYLVRVAHQMDALAICTPSPAHRCFPDIDDALMVLMGLSQGAYLGAKLVRTDAPGILAIAPAQVLPGELVTLTGVLFGSSQGSSVLSWGQSGSSIVVTSWSDNSIVGPFPEIGENGTRWTRDQRVAPRVLIGGQLAVGGDVAVAFPDVTGVQAAKAPGGGYQLAILGGPFGPPSAAKTVTVDGTAILSTQAGVTWEDRRIVVPRPGGAAGAQVSVSVTVRGYTGSAGLAALP